MRVYIITLGCPKNQVDSEMMAVLLDQAGHETVPEPQSADILVVNTCGFIEEARQEAHEVLRELSTTKTRRQALVVAGCLAQRRCEDLCQRFPVDAVLGTRAWPRIVEVVEGLQKHSERTIALTPRRADLITSVQRYALGGPSSYIKIADGCDAACAYCTIPQIKGPQRSKPAAEIEREAQELAAQGVAEVVLIAQDTTAYGRDLGRDVNLAALLRRLDARVPDLTWQRVLYAYPNHITQELVGTMAELSTVCHYLDVPLQHGHPDVLRRMRRPHNVQQIHDMVAALRQAMPDVALRSTFIVGFPGETEAEFLGLLQLLDEIKFDKVGVFQFSAEEGTPANEMPGQVPVEIKQERYDQAMLLQQEISAEINARLVGRHLKVLIEMVDEGVSIGRSYRDAPEIDGVVVIPQELEIGTFANVRVTDADAYDLTAEPV